MNLITGRSTKSYLSETHMKMVQLFLIITLIHTCSSGVMPYKKYIEYTASIKKGNPLDGLTGKCSLYSGLPL